MLELVKGRHPSSKGVDLYRLIYSHIIISYLYTCTHHQQWKIRRALAFSLHELARVLGTDYTCSDLLPVFEEYCTKDIDDVKIGVLSHLVDFFEVSTALFVLCELAPSL